MDIPTKRGIRDGLMSVAHHKCGIGVFSYQIDKLGNSVAKIKLSFDIVD